MTVTTFPVGSVATYTLHGTLVNWGYFGNTATVSPPVGITDPDVGNNSATIGRYRILLMPHLCQLLRSVGFRFIGGGTAKPGGG